MNRYLLSFRQRKVGGPVSTGSLFLPHRDLDIPWDGRLAEITAATPGREVLVLLHGYNNDYACGRERLVRYMDLLAKQDYSGLMLATLWPGDGLAKALTYPFEGRDADDTAAALFRWLTTHVHASAHISFVAHSLGCRVAMNAAQRLAGGNGGPKVGRICLMAPAIDNDSLGRSGTSCYRDATVAADRLAVLASEEDQVLRFAYPLGDLAQTLLYGERWGRALGRTGPTERDPDIVARIEAVSKSRPASNIDHGNYLDVKKDTDGPTIARSEDFVADFLNRSEKPVWPVARGVDPAG